jgi:hypothetical protein
MNGRDHAGGMGWGATLAPLPRAAVALLGSIAVVLAGLSIPRVVSADSPVKLAVEPVDEPGAFFQRSLAAGESSELIVNLANYGPQSIRARTFAADVYPIINGGFGARLRDEPASGATTWLDYPSEELVIGSGEAIHRTIPVAVPVGTKPGEYITSLVIENEDPLPAGEGVAFNQFVRSAVAVVIVVHGPAEAALRLGDARHSFLDGRSVVGVATDNTGDLLLRPAGSFRITTDAGELVDERQVTMGSVYAHTSTWLEVVLDRPLAPGRYFANVDVTDPDRGGPASGARPFEVGQDTGPRRSDPGAIATDTIALPIIGTVGLNPIMVAFGIGVLISATAIGILAVIRRMRRNDRAEG